MYNNSYNSIYSYNNIIKNNFSLAIIIIIITNHLFLQNQKTTKKKLIIKVF